MSQYTDPQVAIDLEFGALDPNAALFAIGIAWRSAGQLRTRHISVLNSFIMPGVKDTGQEGRLYDVDTIGWWGDKNQSAALLYLVDDTPNALAAGKALDAFEEALRAVGIDDTMGKLYASAPELDFGILLSLYKQLGRKAPWYFRNQRDIRTLVDDAQSINEGKLHDDSAPTRHVQHTADGDAAYNLELVEACQRIISFASENEHG